MNKEEVTAESFLAKEFNLSEQETLFYQAYVIAIERYASLKVKQELEAVKKELVMLKHCPEDPDLYNEGLRDGINEVLLKLDVIINSKLK